MSDHAARSALMRMNGREVAIAPSYPGLVADLQTLAMSRADEQETLFQARRVELVSAYGMQPIKQEKPFAFSSGIAIIPVHGTLINRFSSSWGFVTGYNFIRQQTASAGQDPDVLGIVYDHNSYGGEAAGCFECAGDLRKLANGKPTLAVIDSNCYSAAYAMAAGADKIVMTPSGGVGSIGVVAMHVSMEKALAEWGIKVTFIHAGDHKVDGNPFEDLSAEVQADIQKSVDIAYAAFVGHVATSRNKDEKSIRDTEARTYKAEDAMNLGLIDAVATPQTAMLAFHAELSGSTLNLQTKEDSMSEATKPGASTEAPNADQLAKATADAQKAERTRVSGIQSCEEAKGREALANHLAFNTSMSVDDAKGMLAVAPKAAAAAASNPLEAAMAASEHPKVGAGVGGAAGEDASDDQKAAAGILANARAAGVSGFSKPTSA